MREGMAQDIVQPRILVERTLDQLDAHLVDDPADSLLYRPGRNFPEAVDEDDRERIEAGRVPQVDCRDCCPRHPAAARLSGRRLPAGNPRECRYACTARWRGAVAWLVANTTTTDLAPGEIHEIGRAEVERIHGEIHKVMAAVEFDGDMHEFFEFTRTDEQFIFDAPQDLILAHENPREVVDALVPEYFTLLPEADYEIRQFPARILETGAVPLDVLEAHIRDWIAENKSGLSAEFVGA